MGGHGALTLALRHPGVFKPVGLCAHCQPGQLPLGPKPLPATWATQAAWAQHDATR
jgi:S-formylglutathione hydrolase